MTATPRWVIALRGIAIGIAILGAIDPAIISRHATNASVSVVAVDPMRDSAATASVMRALAKDFVVTPAALPSADATVIVGDQLPNDRSDLAVPVFAVSTGIGDPAFAIESINAPVTATLNSRVPITATLHAAAFRGGKVVVALRAGDVVLDQAEVTINTADQRVAVPLTFTPTTPGIAPLRITATATGATASVDLAIDVREQHWSVLFFDPRPSWQSTFVRRAIEGDDRFVVTSRVVTSRNISSSAGAAPATLDDPAGIGRYDAIVIGAPDALGARDVAALETFLRRRAGSVIFLLDQNSDGPYKQLTGVTAWRGNTAGRAESILPTDTNAATGAGSLRAAELAWPSHLADGATPIAVIAPTRGDSTPRAPVIWQLPVGAGRLIVSGALDAWRYRDPSESKFDQFWRTLVGDAAAAAAPPVTAALSTAILAPGESTTLTVAVRDAMLQPLPAHATATASWQAITGTTAAPIRLWPGDGAGEFRGTLRAPETAGNYRIAVSVDGHAIAVPFTVAPQVARPAPDERAILAAWATAHGGKGTALRNVASLASAIRSAIRTAPKAVRWHPMQSIWWLFPFALALSGEWWWRRRHGRR